MKAVAIAVIVLTMSSSCATYTSSRKTAKVGGLMTVAGLTTTVLMVSPCFEGCTGVVGTAMNIAAIVGLAAAATGVPLCLSGLVGMAIRDESQDPEVIERRVVELRAQAQQHARAQAWAVMRQAAASAWAGDCNAVVAASIRVQEIDADFHGTFSSDVAIARCLDAARAVTPAVAPAAP